MKLWMHLGLFFETSRFICSVFYTNSFWYCTLFFPHLPQSCRMLLTGPRKSHLRKSHLSGRTIWLGKPCSNLPNEASPVHFDPNSNPHRTHLPSLYIINKPSNLTRPVHSPNLSIIRTCPALWPSPTPLSSIYIPCDYNNSDGEKTEPVQVHAGTKVSLSMAWKNKTIWLQL